jgi:hypothetical protein
MVAKLARVYSVGSVLKGISYDSTSQDRIGELGDIYQGMYGNHRVCVKAYRHSSYGNNAEFLRVSPFLDRFTLVV